MKRNPYFQAVEKGTFAGKPAGELQSFIRDYARVVLPEGSIDDWRTNDHMPLDRVLGPSSTLPDGRDSTDSGIYGNACFLREGTESDVVEINFQLRDGTFVNLMSAKCWQSREIGWRACDAVDLALSSIFAWEEIPLIVSMYRKLPRKAWWSAKSTLQGEVTITCTGSTVDLRTADGSSLDSADFSGQSSAHLAVEAYVNDWVRVLSVAGVAHVLTRAVEQAGAVVA
ncbi:hypothetical protein [Paraburkholderia youngii]|uniref:hypothetical protein n=1 Tax=Paraburkholderia youngii TaxID=2782701 RepID=UPI003D222CC1